MTLIFAGLGYYLVGVGLMMRQYRRFDDLLDLRYPTTERGAVSAVSVGVILTCAVFWPVLVPLDVWHNRRMFPEETAELASRRRAQKAGKV